MACGRAGPKFARVIRQPKIWRNSIMKIRTKRGFERLAPVEVSKVAGKTIAGFTGNEALPEPPVPPAVMSPKKVVLDDAIIKADKGGSLATARRNALLVEMMVDLNKNASYVDINCNDELTILLSSGYEAVSTNRAQRVLNPPQIVAVESRQSGELRARIRADRNSKSYVGRIKQANGGEFGPTISFASSRDIIFKGLVAGMTYILELMAVGGSTGQSDWSAPGEGMAK